MILGQLRIWARQAKNAPLLVGKAHKKEETEIDEHISSNKDNRASRIPLLIGKIVIDKEKVGKAPLNIVIIHLRKTMVWRKRCVDYKGNLYISLQPPIYVCL